MKFCQSERSLHHHQQSQYTPPCNYYHSGKDFGKIKTGSLYGPTVAREQPIFGLSSRFTGQAEGQKSPGPGSYFGEKGNQQPKQFVKTGIVIRQYKKHGFLGSDDRSPSIPFTQFKPDEEDQQVIKDLQLSQDVNRSALLLKKKAEGFTFSKSPRTLDKALSPKKDDLPSLQTITEYAQKVRKLNMRPKINIKQQLQRTNERRAEIINMINPEFTPSLQLIEMITKRRTKFPPGPGTYINNHEENKSQNIPGKTFAVSRRFSQEKDDNIGPGKYQLKDEKKKSMSFSKSNRNLFNMKGQTDLQHRFYIDPYSNIRKRESMVNKGQDQPFSFGSQVTRFNKIEKEHLVVVEPSRKMKKQSKIQAVIEMRLQKLQLNQKRNTKESEGLLGLSTMASSID